MDLLHMETVLGGETVLDRRIRNPLDLIELSEQGISKDALIHLMEFFQLSMAQMSELLPMSLRTIQRKPLGGRFDWAVSEKILLLAQVAAKGSEVFGDGKRFVEWLKLPHIAFASKTPLELLKSGFGAMMVLDELGRIEHGVFS